MLNVPPGSTLEALSEVGGSPGTVVVVTGGAVVVVDPGGTVVVVVVELVVVVVGGCVVVVVDGGSVVVVVVVDGGSVVVVVVVVVVDGGSVVVVVVVDAGGCVVVVVVVVPPPPANVSVSVKKVVPGVPVRSTLKTRSHGFALSHVSVSGPKPESLTHVTVPVPTLNWSGTPPRSEVDSVPEYAWDFS
jgi:hypothetical protein